MKILALGDVVGEPGRRLVEEFVPALRRETGADLVVVNGENAAHGHGISEGIAKEWFDKVGVDVITTGNHSFDVKGIESFYRQEPRPRLAKSMSLTTDGGKIALKVGIKNKSDYSKPGFDEQFNK